MVGRRLPLLLDRAGRRPGQLVGRSPYMQAVHVDGGLNLLGRIVEVEITAAHANSLAGTLSPPQAAAPRRPMEPRMGRVS